jgi:hypothetical protein
MCLAGAAPAKAKKGTSRIQAVLSSAFARGIKMSVAVLSAIVDCVFAASESRKLEKRGLNFKSIHWREDPPWHFS